MVSKVVIFILKKSTLNILKKFRLNGLAEYVYGLYLTYRSWLIKSKQAIEMQKFGRYAEIEVGHYKLLLDRSELHDFQMLKVLESGGNYEAEVSSYLEKILKPGDTFVDIGANNGYYSILAANIVGSNGKIVSIEPNPNAFQRLLRNIKINNITNIISLNIALSDHDGRATLFLNRGSEDGLASLVKSEQNQALCEVELRRFDHLFAEEEISIVKMDVEGAEIDIIKGMQNYLKNHMGMRIIMEWNPLYRTKSDFDYLRSIFKIYILVTSNNSEPKLIKAERFEDLPFFCNVLLIQRAITRESGVVLALPERAGLRLLERGSPKEYVQYHLFARSCT